MHVATYNAGYPERLKTKLQWAKMGFLPKPEVEGNEYWTNPYCAKRSTYYTDDEVQPATREELDSFFKPMRDCRNAKARAKTEEKRKLLLLEKRRQKIAEITEPIQTVIFDLETTGLNPERDEILQISIINEKEEILLNSLVRPTQTISWPDAERINGISLEMVQDAPMINDLWDQIQTIFFSATQLITYNGEFNLSFLNAVGIHAPDVPYYDVMAEFAPIFGEWSDYFDDWKWQKRSVAARYYDYNFSAHDSLEDVKATLFVYKKIEGYN